MTTPNEFLQHLRDALRHLYDYHHLEHHPLALQYWPEHKPQEPGRGYRLSRMLLESIEQLHPPILPTDLQSSRARAYELLVRRYVDEKPVPDLLRDLSCSRRQFFRDQRKALEMLANLLREKLPQQAPAEPKDQLAVEAHRILDQDEKVDLHQIVASVKQLVAHLAKEHGVEINLDPGPPLLAVRASRTLLRQVFLTVLSR